MRSVAAGAFAFLFFLVVLPVQAHVTVPTDFREVVADASLIVRGRVTDVRSVALPGGGVDSVATVAVENTLKGLALGDFVYVRVPGGDMGRYKFVMVGAPTFKVGQRAVFFLKSGTTDPAYRPIGLTLGVFRVQADPQNGRPVVEPPVVPGRTTGLLTATTRGDVRRRMMPVQEFESLVRLMAGTQASGPAGASPDAPAGPTPFWRRR